MSEFRYIRGCRFKRPRELDFTCGEYGPVESDEVNAMMAIASTARDPNDSGLLTGFLLPPAVAAALIAAVRSGDVVRFAREFKAAQVRPGPKADHTFDIELPPLRYD